MHTRTKIANLTLGVAAAALVAAPANAAPAPGTASPAPAPNCSEGYTPGIGDPTWTNCSGHPEEITVLTASSINPGGYTQSVPACVGPGTTNVGTAVAAIGYPIYATGPVGGCDKPIGSPG